MKLPDFIDRDKGFCEWKFHHFKGRSSSMRLDFTHGTIRDWTREDISDLARSANDIEIARNVGNGFPHPYTETDAADWINQVSAMPVPTHWAIEVEGHAAGGTGFHLKEEGPIKFGVFGYWLARAYWGRGIVTAAVRALAPRIISDFRLIRLDACVYIWNPASMRVLEKAGFERKGLLPQCDIKDGIPVQQILFTFMPDSTV